MLLKCQFRCRKKKKKSATTSREAYIWVNPYFEIVEMMVNKLVEKKPILLRINPAFSDFIRRAVVGDPVAFVVISVPILNHACWEDMTAFDPRKWIFCIGDHWEPGDYTMSVSFPKAIPEYFLL